VSLLGGFTQNGLGSTWGILRAGGIKMGRSSLNGAYTESLSRNEEDSMRAAIKVLREPSSQEV